MKPLSTSETHLLLTKLNYKGPTHCGQTKSRTTQEALENDPKLCKCQQTAYGFHNFNMMHMARTGFCPSTGAGFEPLHGSQVSCHPPGFASGAGPVGVCSISERPEDTELRREGLFHPESLVPSKSEAADSWRQIPKIGVCNSEQFAEIRRELHVLLVGRGPFKQQGLYALREVSPHANGKCEARQGVWPLKSCLEGLRDRGSWVSAHSLIDRCPVVPCFAMERTLDLESPPPAAGRRLSSKKDSTVSKTSSSRWDTTAKQSAKSTSRSPWSS